MRASSNKDLHSSYEASMFTGTLKKCLSVCLCVRSFVSLSLVFPNTDGGSFFPNAFWGSGSGGFSYRLRYTCYFYDVCHVTTNDEDGKVGK